MAGRKQSLFTIGYEGATPDRLAAALREAGVATLIDVRAIAASRRLGFAKRALSERVRAEGIEYVHLRDLGTPKPGREAARRGEIERMRSIFAAHMERPEARDALHQAIELARAASACLLCLERDHDSCHRAIVADAMAARAGFKVVRLVP